MPSFTRIAATHVGAGWKPRPPITNRGVPKRTGPTCAPWFAQRLRMCGPERHSRGEVRRNRGVSTLACRHRTTGHRQESRVTVDTRQQSARKPCRACEAMIHEGGYRCPRRQPNPRDDLAPRSTSSVARHATHSARRFRARHHHNNSPNLRTMGKCEGRHHHHTTTSSLLFDHDGEDCSNGNASWAESSHPPPLPIRAPEVSAGRQ